MALIKRGNVWHVRKMVEGHILARSTKTGDKKLAAQIAAKMEAEFLTEIVIQGTKPVTVHVAIDAFLTARIGTGGYESATTHFKHWLKLPNKPFREVEVHELQAIIQTRRSAGAAHNTIAVMVRYWNALVSFAKNQGWSVPAKLPVIKQERTKLRFLSYEEENRILQAINPGGKYPGKNHLKEAQRAENADLFVCLMHTGARISEIMQATWDQVDLERRMFLIRRKKGGKDTLISMSRKLYEVLARRKSKAANHFIFPTKVHANNTYRWLDAALKRAGISEEGGKITPHTTRHTFASRMLNAGLSIIQVKELLGHNNIASTMTYLHYSPTLTARRAAEVLDSGGER